MSIPVEIHLGQRDRRHVLLKLTGRQVKVRYSVSVMSCEAESENQNGRSLNVSARLFDWQKVVQ